MINLLLMFLFAKGFKKLKGTSKKVGKVIKKESSFWIILAKEAGQSINRLNNFISKNSKSNKKICQETVGVTNIKAFDLTKYDYKEELTYEI